MAKEGKWDYCTTCRKIREYRVKKILQKEWIRGMEYEFEFTVAVCKDCGFEMDIPGIMDLNIQEMDEQYRKAEEILSLVEIQKVWEVCSNIENEEVMCHYLKGQIPTKGESDRIREILRRIGNKW